LSRHLILPFLVYAVLLSACSSAALPYARIDRALMDGNPAEAVNAVEKARDAYGRQSTVLYLMDKGMVQCLAGQYTDSNDSLSRAEALSEDFYTLRIRSELESFLTSDKALPYEGEEFEKVLLNVLMAMNYAQLGLWDDALVEARKVDHKLTVLADRNQKRMTYSTDALARYLSGVLYETMGDLGNAFVAYRLAFDAFNQYRQAYGTPVPDMLRQDLLRVSEAVGLTQEHEEYKHAFGGIAWQSEAAAQSLGEVVFITYAGHAPIKRDFLVDIPFSADALGLVLATKRYDRNYSSDHRAAESILYGLTGRVVRVAVPRFVPRPSGIVYTEAIITGGDARYTSRSALMENITAIAEKDLEERLFRTAVKAVARAAWKYALAEAIRAGVRGAVKDKEAGMIVGAVAGALVHIFAIASEESDKRSWATLPDRVHVGRLKVPPGTYDVELRHIGLFGGVVASQTMRGVVVPERGKRFVSARVLQ
jgi:hypothetical protein